MLGALRGSIEVSWLSPVSGRSIIAGCKRGCDMMPIDPTEVEGAWIGGVIGAQQGTPVISLHDIIARDSKLLEPLET